MKRLSEKKVKNVLFKMFLDSDVMKARAIAFDKNNKKTFSKFDVNDFIIFIKERKDREKYFLRKIAQLYKREKDLRAKINDFEITIREIKRVMIAFNLRLNTFENTKKKKKK